MEFVVRFSTIFRCLGGAAGSSFGDIFRFLETRFSRVISDTFREGFFMLPGRFLDSSEHRFRELSVVVGPGRNGTPARTGATFSMF